MEPERNRRDPPVIDTVHWETPSWGHLAAGGDLRRKWFVHWFGEVPLAGLQWLLFHVMRVLPIDLVSAFGGLVGRTVGPLFFPLGSRVAEANLRWLEPTWDDDRVRRTVKSHYDNIGRVKAEFAILHRLMKRGRIRIENADALMSALERGPVVLVGSHVSNWETIAPVLASLDVPAFDIFEPQPSRLQTRIALQVRAECAAPGTVFYTSNSNAPREALRWLKAGRALVIFCDETIDGACRVPFFGRPAHTRGNYAYAIRFARLSRGTLVPFHVVRHRGCRFTVHFGAPIHPAASDRSRADLQDEVLQLDRVLETNIRANLGNWWWLDWAFAGVTYPFKLP